MRSGPVGRAAAPGISPGRKVRAPRKDGAGQRPARATSGKVPQRRYRSPADIGLPMSGFDADIGDIRCPVARRRPPSGGSRRVRVKRWGKSPPRTRQRGRHGKPHREQDRIGAARARTSPGLFRTSRPGWLREASSNGRPRRMAATWAMSPPYRTRLTGRLAPSLLMIERRADARNRAPPGDAPLATPPTPLVKIGGIVVRKRPVNLDEV